MISKCLQVTDYAGLSDGLRPAFFARGTMQGKGLPLYVPHEHRMWEYGSAIQAYHDRFGKSASRRVLDIGSGHTLLGPALALEYGCSVQETDILDLKSQRGDVRAGLDIDLDFRQESLLELDDQADAVLCISVIEHIKPEDQELAWQRLCAAVKPGGMLFVTTDYSDEPEGDWDNDEGRESKYGYDMVKRAINWIDDAGLKVPRADLRYYGPQVFNYTFYRLYAERP